MTEQEQPVLSPGLSVREQVTYVLTAGGAVAAGMGLIGAGEASLLFGGIAGGAALLFGKEIHGVLARHAPAPMRRQMQRPAGRSLSWWLHGEPERTVTLSGEDSSEESAQEEEQQAPCSPSFVPDGEQAERGQHTVLPHFPVYGTATLRAKVASREVLFSENLGLDIDEVIDAGIFVAGMKGSGKSSLAARLMEQVAHFPVPQVIFDLKGDFVSLLDSHFAGRAVLMRAGYIPPADYVLAQRACVVVDLRSWPTWNARAQLVGAYCADLLAAAMALPQTRRLPWFVHLDEAQQFVAQARPHELSEGAWRAAKDAVTNLGVLGRAYGAVPCLYTQRIAAIHKDTIAQVSLLVFMKAALSNDLDRYEEYLGKGPVTRAEIAAFGAGECVMHLPDGRRLRVQCLPRESRHGSPTPHLAQAMRAVCEPETAPPLPAVKTGMLRDRAGHPLQARRHIGSVRAQAVVSPVRSPRLTRAARKWHEGANSIRKLMLAEGINFNQARQLKVELERAGLIEGNKQEA